MWDRARRERPKELFLTRGRPSRVTESVASDARASIESDRKCRFRRAQVPLPPVDEKKKVIEDVDKDRRCVCLNK